jgi:hypothetical protein
VPEPDGAETDADLATEPPQSVTATQVLNLWRRVEKRESVWLKAEQRASDRAKQAEHKLHELEQRLEQVTEREERAAARDVELAALERELEIQRTDAAQGFAEQNRQALEELRSKREELLAELDGLREQERAAARLIRADAQREIDNERELLATERQQLERTRQQVNLKNEELTLKSEFLAGKEVLLEEHVERRAGERVADAEARASYATQLQQQLSARVEALQQELTRTLSQLGSDPAGVLRRNEELLAQVRSLRNEIAFRPTPNEAEELRNRADRATKLEAESREWRRRHDQIDRELRYQMVSVGELEVLRDERDSLIAARDALRSALDEQKREWNELVERDEDKQPFAACSAYDVDPTLQRRAETSDPGDLEALAVEIRHRMATPDRPDDPAFYYDPREVRIFLAGLATSRLHLLQGISGTGKTSLPLQFAKALGGHSQVIEVQAGWRDKDDLLGYYNAFERRFYESEFTKAIYRAGAPQFEDRVVIVVLDEMNLAHPEQYFGVMLSKLENAGRTAVGLELVTRPLENAPTNFVDGSKLPLVPNVWFVGTANHDETTVAFADKTYDRAHVQELPERHPTFQAQPNPDTGLVSYEGLIQAFDMAGKQHSAASQRALSFLNAVLRPELATFGVGWGNRLEAQVRSFVPVVIAAGGELGEAVDHLVATKLVRKLEDRFGVAAAALDDLARKLESSWSRVDAGSKPQRSVDRLMAEAKRLRALQAS